ncbi:MAG TPA: hypothetical protein VFC57_05265 [Aeromicrobium sp.]|nr:hypothetical protein [Aeromicrobium sp.]
MQGTIATYERSKGSGTILLDDGARRGFGSGTLVQALHLRPGQRVHVDLDGAGEITVIRIF